MVWTYNSGFEYLNLSDASEAEREILRSMLFEGPEEVATKNVLFQFLKPPPPSLSRCESDNDTESSSGPCEFFPGSDHGTSDSHPQNHNGPLQHMNVHLDQPNNEMSNATSPNSLAGQGPPPPQQLRSFYPAGQVMSAPHMQGGPTPSHPMGHHIPISAYQPQITHGQMIQTQNYYGHPAMAQQYQMMHYGQPTHSYPPPTQYHQADIDHSLNQTHHNQKGHHESTHSPNPSGAPPKYRNKNNQRPRRNEDQNMNHNTYPPFYPNMGYAPVYYNPGIAQTVTNMTGPPLIMPGGGQPHTTMYAPYPTQSHMYATTPGSDVDQPHGVTVVPVELSAEISVPISAQQPAVITEKDKPKDNPKSNAIVDEPCLSNSLSPSSEKQTKLIAAKGADIKVENNTAVSPVPEKIPEDTKVPLKPKPTVLSKPAPEGLPTGIENSVSIPLNQAKSSQSETVSTRQTAENPDQVNKSKTLKSTNGPASVSLDSSHQRASSNTSAGKGKYATNTPDFPELGQSGGCSPTPPKTSVANKERSWASIASSKTLNGPSNGIVTNSATVDNGSIQIVNSAVDDNYDGYQYNAQSPRASLSNPSTKNEYSTYVESSHDKSSLSDENDPIALHLGEFLTNYTLDHHSLSLTPRGLSNQSNYCYINATLQSLIACPPFVNLFRAMKDVIGKQPCKATPIIQSVYDFVMEFDPITRVSHGNRLKRPSDAFYIGANFEAAGIRRVLGLLDGATFKVEGRQEDAEEFLSHLLNGLHDEMMKVIKWLENKKDRMNSRSSNTVTGPPMSPSMNGDSPEIKGDEDDDQWQVMGPKNKGCMTRKTCFSKSPISEMFVGQMCSALNRTIGLKSTTLQPFFTLQLDIQEDNIHSVRDALEGLSTKEEVTGFTSVTGQETEAWKQLSLEVLPIILILHMKRFVYDKSGNKIYKLDKKVEFPVDLEIGRDLLSINSKGKYTPKQRQYKLFAAVYHDGEEAHKGHYIADCFHPSGGSLWGQFGWIRYDDTAVKGIAENHILNPQPPRVPYLLYYRRVDTLSQAKKERL